MVVSAMGKIKHVKMMENGGLQFLQSDRGDGTKDFKEVKLMSIR